jgi:trehalose synthase
VTALTDVPVAAISPERFAEVLTAEQWARFHRRLDETARLLDGRVVWNLNSTAKGGGVAEMLGALLPYVAGAGIATRWLVMEGDDDFFRITKRIHNHLHGSGGDSAELGEGERSHYERVAAECAAELCPLVRRGDLVLLHDPQTAGLIPALRDCGAAVVWRCHVGLDTPNRLARTAWEFLMPYVAQADAYVFSRRAFAWEGLDGRRIQVIAPSIDPFSPKNLAMAPTEVDAVLESARVVASNGSKPGCFRRQDGSMSPLRHTAALTEEQPVDAGTTLVLQVSRWDRLKDHAGVLQGFARAVAPRSDAHLMLAGPSVEEVADDPEDAECFRDVRAQWQALPAATRGRVHLACLPMADDDENAAIVNALQRRAQVVVQKSLAEGFGLTVAEAMWKARPVVASRIGGIQDQVEHGVSGLLVDDPADLEAFGAAVCDLLGDPARARDIGEAARDRVRDGFLGTRHLAEFGALLATLVHPAAVR